MADIRRCEVTEKQLNSAEFEKAVSDLTSGAVAIFSGNVRNHDHGREVRSLYYEIHPSAEDVLRDVVTEVAGRHEIHAIAAAHRYGAIPLGESAFLVAISSAHRGPAFDACRELVDEVKARLPIWKRQEFTDGTAEWVNFA